MNDIIRIEADPHEPSLPTPRKLPGPKVDIAIRPGTLDDYPFIDALQKQHSKAVGFMFEGVIKGHIEKGHVLIAEAGAGVRGSGSAPNPDTDCDGQSPSPDPEPRTPDPTPVGYLIAVDRYLKRDELGIIYQLNIAPGSQRGLIGANLLKAQFDRSAYGCRLYCCWCAQDLAANHFWEAMGFVPLAFRTGGGRPRNSNSKKQPRMHIFWQKRIRQGDTGDPASGGTPYWFPSQTGAGAIGEDRIVLPIPPGTHWSDAKPVVLPNGARADEETLRLEAKVSELEKAKKAAKQESRGGVKRAEKPKQVKSVAAGGLRFGPPEVSAAGPAPGNGRGVDDAAQASQRAKDQAAAIEAELKEAKKAVRKAKKKFDPAQEAFARELKDRWLEEVAARPGLLAPSAARYDVSRRLPERRNEQGGEDEVLRLDAA